jgi:DNA-binding response OmpR family regulator
MSVVFLIEDEKVLNKNISELLQEEGYEVLSFQDGLDALDFIAAHPSKIPDIIISDINMPLVSGYEFTRRWKGLSERHKQVPIIAVTAMGQQHDISKGKLLEMDEYLIKPVDFEELLSKVSYHLSMHA